MRSFLRTLCSWRINEVIYLYAFAVWFITENLYKLYCQEQIFNCDVCQPVCQRNTCRPCLTGKQAFTPYPQWRILPINFRRRTNFQFTENAQSKYFTRHFGKLGSSSDTFGESILRQSLSSLLFIKYIIKVKGNEISGKSINADAVEWFKTTSDFNGERIQERYDSVTTARR